MGRSSTWDNIKVARNVTVGQVVTVEGRSHRINQQANPVESLSIEFLAIGRVDDRIKFADGSGQAKLIDEHLAERWHLIAR